MYKAIGIWSWPAPGDLTAFDEHYASIHYPLAAKLPELRRITVLTAPEVARETNIYRLAEVYWDDRASFDRAAQSEEWQAMADDATGLMERFGVTLTAVDGVEEEQAY